MTLLTRLRRHVKTTFHCSDIIFMTVQCGIYFVFSESFIFQNQYAIVMHLFTNYYLIKILYYYT